MYKIKNWKEKSETFSLALFIRGQKVKSWIKTNYVYWKKIYKYLGQVELDVGSKGHHQKQSERDPQTFIGLIKVFPAAAVVEVEESPPEIYSAGGRYQK